MLEFVAKALTDNSISFVLLKGSSRHRGKFVSEFQSDKSIKVLLMSLRTDASGLTLTQATHVFLLEPSLNPAIEDQAVNRVHRIGQTCETYVHRFYMKNSVEEKILEMQRQKRHSHKIALEKILSQKIPNKIVKTKDNLNYSSFK